MTIGKNLRLGSASEPVFLAMELNKLGENLLELLIKRIEAQ